MIAGAAPRVIAITDLTALPGVELARRLEDLAQRAAPGSVALLLRDHQASVRERLELGRQLLRIARQAQQQLWVADRLDLALVLQADAAHLGDASVSALAARRLLGPDVMISRAWHQASLSEAGTQQELAAVDALLLSPVLAARKGRTALGLPALTSFAGQLRARNHAARLYALGGITATHARACLAAGAWGVAAMGAVLAPDASELLSALGIQR